jgi:hypothetical protein
MLKRTRGCYRVRGREDPTSMPYYYVIVASRTLPVGCQAPQGGRWILHSVRAARQPGQRCRHDNQPAHPYNGRPQVSRPEAQGSRQHPAAKTVWTSFTSNARASPWPALTQQFFLSRRRGSADSEDSVGVRLSQPPTPLAAYNSLPPGMCLKQNRNSAPISSKDI